MKSRIYVLLKTLIVRCGFTATRVAKKSEIIEVISRLQPIQTKFSWVRAGPELDGGYWIPKEIGEIEAVFSPGVGDSSDFELHFANLGIDCYLLDASVEGPPTSHKKFKFSKRFLGATTSGDRVSLKDWIKESRLEDSTKLLLQMDIEGSEYETILGTQSSTFSAFKVMAIEFHKIDLFVSKFGLVVFNAIIDVLLTNHSVVMLQANNAIKPFMAHGVVIPPVIEIILVRNDLIREKNEDESINAIPKSSLNVANKKPVRLPSYWTGELNGNAN